MKTNLKANSKSSLMLVFICFIILFSFAFVNSSVTDYNYDTYLNLTNEPQGLFWNSNGLNFYYTSWIQDKIYQMNCSQAWNISTCSNNNNMSLTDGSSQSGGFYLTASYLFVAGLQDAGTDEFNLYRYSCTNGFNNISSCSYDYDNLTIQDAVDFTPYDLWLDSTGTELIVLQQEHTGTSRDSFLYQYSCGSAYDLSSCSYVKKKDLSIKGLSGIWFSNDYKTLYITRAFGYGDDSVRQYACSSFDIDTCSYTKKLTGTTNPYDSFVGNTSNYLYVLQAGTNDRINQYEYFVNITRLQNILNQSLTYSEERALYLDEYYTNFTTAKLTINGETISASLGGTADYYNSSSLDVYLIPLSNFIALGILSKDTDVSEYVNMSFTSSYDTKTDDFYIIVEEQPVSGAGSTSSGVLAGITNWFTDLTPNEETLSTKQRYAIVFVVMLFIGLVLGYGFASTGSLGSGALAIIGGIEAVALLYFTSIGYINIIIPIMLFVGIFAFAYFKFRSP